MANHLSPLLPTTPLNVKNFPTKIFDRDLFTSYSQAWIRDIEPPSPNEAPLPSCALASKSTQTALLALAPWSGGGINPAMVVPRQIQLVENEVAIVWMDGKETFLAPDRLRAASPSAAVRGEPDIFGRVSGAEGKRDYSGVTVIGWSIVGNYAVRFDFSDGHNTGLFTFDLLRRLGGEDVP